MNETIYKTLPARSNRDARGIYAVVEIIKDDSGRELKRTEIHRCNDHLIAMDFTEKCNQQAERAETKANAS